MEKLGVLSSYFGLLFRRLRRIIMPPDSTAKATHPVVASISGTAGMVPNTDPPTLKNIRVIPIIFFILSSEQ